MDFLKQLLSDHTGPLIQRLTDATGFKLEEAQAFVPAAITQVVEQLKGGGFDLSSLLGGGNAASDLVSKLDADGLAQTAGIDVGKARAGLETVVPGVLEGLKAKAGGAGDLLSMLGGSDAGGLLGKVSGFLKR